MPLYTRLLFCLGLSALLTNTAQAAPARAIAVGLYHTCTLSSAGTVQCWGENYYGQLGDNSSTNRLTPVSVLGLSSGITAIAAGVAHTCALNSAGAVQCWGQNKFGQLGNNSTTLKLTPVAVVALSSDITAIATGVYHTCALSSAGAVQCWGNNASGQLGDNSTTTRLTPVPVVGLSHGITAIAAGDSHTCALSSAGAVQCWGANWKGQLGDNSMKTRLTPVAVVGLSHDITAIAAGTNHTCALSSAGAVQCWGFNDSGQLGDNSTTTRLTPVPVVGLSHDITAIAVGESYYTCALSSAGAVQCWGENYYGQLGDNSGTNRLTPVSVLGLGSDITALGAGWGHACALSGAGVVQCWGRNSSGQLGDNSTTNKLAPVLVVWLDTDADGVNDFNDAFPLDATETLDTDNDGIGNNADPDDDNDGVPDAFDAFPLDSNPTLLLDGSFKGSSIKEAGAKQ